MHSALRNAGLLTLGAPRSHLESRANMETSQNQEKNEEINNSYAKKAEYRNYLLQQMQEKDQKEIEKKNRDQIDEYLYQQKIWKQQQSNQVVEEDRHIHSIRVRKDRSQEKKDKTLLDQSKQSLQQIFDLPLVKEDVNKDYLLNQKLLIEEISEYQQLHQLQQQQLNNDIFIIKSIIKDKNYKSKLNDLLEKQLESLTKVSLDQELMKNTDLSTRKYNQMSTRMRKQEILKDYENLLLYMKFQKPKTVKSHFRDVDDRSESRIETIPEEQSNVFSETVQEAEESVIESRDPEFEREIITLQSRNQFILNRILEYRATNYNTKKATIFMKQLETYSKAAIFRQAGLRAVTPIGGRQKMRLRRYSEQQLEDQIDQKEEYQSKVLSTSKSQSKSQKEKNAKDILQEINYLMSNQSQPNKDNKYREITRNLSSIIQPKQGNSSRISLDRQRFRQKETNVVGGAALVQRRIVTLDDNLNKIDDLLSSFVVVKQ